MLGQADPELQAQLLNDSRLFSTVPQPDADVTITSDSCTLPSNNALLINNGEECGRPQAHSNHLPENQDALLQSQLTCPPTFLSEQFEDLSTGNKQTASVGTTSLDPGASSFVSKDRVLGGLQPTNLAVNLDQVRQVQAGGVGYQGVQTDASLWNSAPVTGCRVACGMELPSSSISELPFSEVDDISDVLGIAPKEIHNVGRLLDLHVKLPVGDFYDKVLPAPTHPIKINQVFTPDYFIALHNLTTAAGVRDDGSSYAAFTPNHLGARMSLPHTKLRLHRWRYHLRGYEMIEICQYLEFGFPV